MIPFRLSEKPNTERTIKQNKEETAERGQVLVDERGTNIIEKWVGWQGKIARNRTGLRSFAWNTSQDWLLAIAAACTNARVLAELEA